MQKGTASSADVEAIPIYREGGTDDESSRRLSEDRPSFVVRAFRKAGPIFRTSVDGKMWVIMAGMDANDFVWRNTDLWNYPVMFPGFLEQMGPDHLNNLEGEGHRQKRAVLKPAFDQAPAMRYLSDFNRCFHEDLGGAVAAGPVDLIEFWSEAITRANTKTVAQVELSRPALKRLVRWERELLAGLALGEGRHAYYAREEYVQLKAEAMGLMGTMVDSRLARPGLHDDNFSGVLRARSQQPGGYPGRGCLVDDLYYILVAGVENTSRLITWTALHCQFASQWGDRLREEISGWDGVDPMALSAMTNLKAVIMETQRLRPPAFFVPRQSTREFEFAGHRVPAGADILNANALCHFLDELYEEPYSFRPERFIEGGRFVPRSFGFFGGGVHICLGRNHTMMQTPVALAQIFKYHDLSYRDEPGLRAIMANPDRSFPPEIWADIRLRTPR
jgi:cytochrome P450